jgi:hypothetical protein
MADPIIPNACSIPCICRTFINASSVVILIDIFPLLIGVYENSNKNQLSIAAN